MVNKKGRPPARRPYGTISENRIAWLETYIGQFVVMQYPEGYRDDDPDFQAALKAEPGPTIRLNIVHNGRPVALTVTTLTTEELDHMERLFKMLFDMARPIVEARDKAAQDAYENGDDSFVRIYRQVPKFVVREGAIRANSVSLRDRPEGAADGAGDGEPGPGGLRGVGPKLAELQQEAGGPEHDEPQAD